MPPRVLVRDSFSGIHHLPSAKLSEAIQLDPALTVLHPSGETVPMLSPDKGQIGDVPYENLESAIAAGFHLAADMVAPNGAEGTVPVLGHQFDEALQKLRLKHMAGAGLPEIPQGWTRFRSSDGAIHDIDSRRLNEARTVDKRLVVLGQK